jgi:hypothetical protein
MNRSLLEAELQSLMASPEFAWGHGMACNGGRNHPKVRGVVRRAETIRAILNGGHECPSDS